MERKQLFVYIAIFIVMAVLLVIVISDYYTIRSMSGQLDIYKKQQQELSSVITAQYLGDISAAKRAWMLANQDEYIALQNQGISVEADTLQTPGYTVVFDLQDPSGTLVYPAAGDVSAGEAVVYLGEYYQSNMTRIPGWTASYSVNMTTHAVDALTPALIESIAYQYYAKSLAPSIYQTLGVSNDTVQGAVQRTIDCSYVADSGTWIDVSEYRYTLRNTDLAPYLLVKIYVNATTQQVDSYGISMPYYSSVTGVDY